MSHSRLLLSPRLIEERQFVHMDCRTVGGVALLDHRAAVRTPSFAGSEGEVLLILGLIEGMSDVRGSQVPGLSISVVVTS
jgi:hypothetical protein